MKVFAKFHLAERCYTDAYGTVQAPRKILQRQPPNQLLLARNSTT